MAAIESIFATAIGVYWGYIEGVTCYNILQYSCRLISNRGSLPKNCILTRYSRNQLSSFLLLGVRFWHIYTN